MGAFFSGLFLFGISLIYSFTGIIHFGDLAKFLNNILILKNEFRRIGISVGSVFILIGLFFKLANAAFHMWGPNVYEGAPTRVNALFTILLKIAFLTLFNYFCIHFILF